ncbi:MAG: NUDIX domain-containing protein [Candidatus Dadabacteria bacterium]|nr:NUDIX domain-containing protein [Candidatus Dadabacteria bacterium]MCY4261903.1 NUDIX domain-containing protein [Candidatus Dadabacteria bacterium]
MVSSGEYDSRAFPPVAVTVDIVMLTICKDSLQVLLIKRGEEPFLGGLALPGGFLKPDEDLDAAARRELAEETGVISEEDYLEQFGVYSSPERDPRMRVVTVAYWAICSDLTDLVEGGDAEDPQLVPVSRIDQREIDLAFDHYEIVRDAVKHALGRLESPLIAAKFCPPQFTISELRRVYEAAWSTRIDQGNFQRKIRASNMFRNLSAEKSSSGPKGGRPASLWSVSEMDTLAAGIEKPEQRVDKIRKRGI